MLSRWVHSVDGLLTGTENDGHLVKRRLQAAFLHNWGWRPSWVLEVKMRRCKFRTTRLKMLVGRRGEAQIKVQLE